eukprot:16429999-Heterocapsa_arctica.AAC.1
MPRESKTSVRNSIGFIDFDVAAEVDVSHCLPSFALRCAIFPQVCARWPPRKWHGRHGVES